MYVYHLGENMFHFLILIILYLFPAVALIHFSIDTFLRNPRRTEYQLASLTLLAVMIMFVEEFIRQIQPVSYSAPLVFYVFGNFGALSAVFVMHFYFKISENFIRIRPLVYIPLSYVLLVPTLLTLTFQHNIYNSTNFYRAGIWIQPIYNTRYYISISIGIMVIIGLSVMVYIAKNRADTQSSKKRLITLFYATVFIAFWHVVFGILPGLLPAFRELPPYPYIYGDLIWLGFLRWSMSTQDLLPHFSNQYKALFNLVPVAIVVADTKHKILEANPTAKQTFGEHPVNLLDLLPRPRRQYQSLINSFLSKSSINNVETELLREDGAVISALLSVDFVEVEGMPISISVIRDITDRKHAEQRILHLAYHDSLTDLPNRALFYQTLENAVVQTGTETEIFAVILVDIDHFKQINDSFGHQVGDRAIQFVASTLRSVIQSGDIVARLGGDEFVLMLKNFSTRDQIQSLTKKIVDELNSPVAVENHSVLLSASVGVAIFPEHGITADALVKSADIAMYEAKHTGRNRLVVFAEQVEVSIGDVTLTKVK